MKYKNKKIHNILLKICFLFFLLFLPASTVFSASKLKIRYNKKTVNYTGKQAKVSLDGKQVNLNQTPGILINGTSLVPYKDVFKNSLGVSCKYDSNKKIITMKQFGNTIKLKLNSTIATVNGRRTSVSVAPRKVKFYNANQTKIFVPTRFIAEALGYGYNWTESNAQIAMTTPFAIYYDKKWENYTGVKSNVVVDNKKISLKAMPGILIEETLFVPAKKVFTNEQIGASYEYKKEIKQAALTKEDTKIVFTIGSQVASINGKDYTMDAPAKIVKNGKTKKSYVMVPISFVAAQFGYDYKWDSNNGILTTKSDQTGEQGTKDPQTPSNAYFSMQTEDARKEEVTMVSNLSDTNHLNGNGTSTGNITVSMDSLATGTIEKYLISSDTGFGIINSSYEKDSNTILIDFDNTKAENKTEVMNQKLIEQIETVYNLSASSTQVQLKAAAKNMKYQMTLSEDGRTLTISVYPNYLIGLSALKEEETQKVTLTGLSLLNTKVSEDDTHIYIECKNTINALGSQVPAFTSELFLQNISIDTLVNGSTQITIQKTKNSDYKIESTGNQTTFILSEVKIEEQEPEQENPFPLASTEIKFLKPEGIKLSDLKDEDNYLSNQFVITIPGNYVDFYNSNPITSNGNAVSNISVSLNTAGNTNIVVRTKTVQGYKITEKKDSFVVLVDSPSKIYKNIVVLDPGHGGSAPGAGNGSLLEKNLTLQIMYNKAQKYFNAKDSTIKAYWTRINDSDVDNFDRAAFAEKVEADLFISLHMNSFNGSASGFETWYAAENNKENQAGLSSSKLASYLNKKLASDLEISSNRGVKSNPYIVCKYNTVPAALIELGFIDNKTDVARLKSDSYQEQAAASIYQAVKEIFELYPTGR